jgi:hypothetical protein
MRNVELDFERAHRPRFVGRVLLGGASVIAIGTVVWTIMLHQEKNQSATLLDSLEKTRTGARLHAMAGGKADAPVQAAQLKRAQEIILRMAFPWQAFFDVIETAKSNNIAIVSLQPDAVTGSVVIAAEARDLPSALDYIERLKAEPRLQNIHMATHEALDHGARSAVKFTVNAHWARNAEHAEQSPLSRTVALVEKP